MDFGVALVNQSNLTQQGIWMGTANYMAPEYLDTGVASPASDLFAVGVMLYEVITGGRKPFTGETTTLVLNAILRNPPQPFRPEEIQGANPMLLQAVRKALAKRVEDRFPNAEALAAAIRAAASESGIGRAQPAVKAEVPPLARRESTDSKLLIVGKGGKATCLSLRVALRQAVPGALITLLPGVYRESVVVDKDVSILGEGNPAEIILESVQGPCLSLKAGQVKLQGFTLRRSSPNEQDVSPVILIQSGRTLLEDCELAAEQGSALVVGEGGAQAILRRCHIHGQPEVGIEARRGSSTQISHCMIEGATRAGLRIGRTASANLSHTVFRNGEGLGVSVQLGGQAQLEDCEIQECLAGSLEVAAEARAYLSRCTLDTSHYAGVLALEKGQVTLESCDLLGHAASGLHAVEGAIVSLRQCHLHHNPGFGLSILDRGLCTLEDCEINDNDHPGVFVNQNGTVQLKNSKLHDGKSLGVVCANKGRGVLEGCEIFGNAQSGAKVEGAAACCWSVASSGTAAIRACCCSKMQN
jgi:hypothetical protein